MLIKAFLTGHRLIQEDHGTLSYTVFTVDVFVDGIQHVLEKRYSEFEELHKVLKKQIHVPSFPPKKVLNKNAKFIEERRRHLEAYIQEILQMRQYPSELLEFLQVFSDDAADIHDFSLGSFANDNSSLNISVGGQGLQNQGISMCPFAKSSSPVDDIPSREVTPDIILQGLYRSLYVS